ncbi:hypothetical protein L3X38_004649 [Prunus dulcis]|uniref:Uncharacterized protein n=1 Tax=Prunus dulcis TaxID=3755 RepID=A0AAD4ZPA7_PRUDU|nr:hypothetical protein L3X38_004649 [Prunus dulcis]
MEKWPNTKWGRTWGLVDMTGEEGFDNEGVDLCSWGEGICRDPVITRRCSLPKKTMQNQDGVLVDGGSGVCNISSDP